MQARAEIVIVGGGIAGASIAYHLAQLGKRDVVVLEQRQRAALKMLSSPLPLGGGVAARVDPAV